MATAGASGPRPPRGEPRRGRGARWLRRCVVSGVVVLLLGGIVGVVAWRHRLRLFNRWLSQLDLPIHAEAGAIEWRAGGFRIGEVALRTSDGGAMGRIREVDISISPGSARHGRVDSVAVQGLRLTVDPGLWHLLTAGAPGGSAGSGPVRTWEIGRVSLVDAAVEVTPQPGSRIEAAFDWEGGVIGSTPRDGLRFEGQRVRLHRLAGRASDGGRAEVTGGSVEWSLDPTGRTLVVARAAWSGGTLDLTPGLIGFGALAAQGTAPAVGAPPAAVAPATPTWTVVVNQAALGFDHFAWSAPGGASVSGKGTIEGSDFRWDGDWSAGGHRIELSGLKAAVPGRGESSQIEVASASSRVSRERGQAAVLETIEFTDPLVHLAAGVWGPPATAVDRTSAEPSRAGVRPLAVIKSGRLSNGTVVVAGVAAPVPTGDRPAIRAVLTARARELTIFSDGRVGSPSEQSLVVKDAEVAYLDEQPVLEFASLEVEAVPDEVVTKKTLSRVEWSGANVRVDARLLKHFDFGSSPPSFPAPPAGRGEADTRWWNGLTAGELGVEEVRITVASMGARMPDVSGRLAVTTRPTDGSYRVVVSDLAATAPAMPEVPLVRAAEVALTVHPLRMWDRRLDGLALSGVELAVGPALQSLAPTGPVPPAAPLEPLAAPPEPAEPGWHLGSFSVESSRVEVSNLVPLLDPVTFQIAFQLNDIPLTAEGLRARDAPQRVEFSHLRLNSAYGSSGSLPVAELDHLFLEFSLAGLVDQRLDRVEVIGPTIYVGEQLFWYIDYFRRYASRGTLAGGGGGTGVAVAAADRGPTGGAGAGGSRPAADPSGTHDGWSVTKLDAYYGKFVLALKGSIIDALPALPFSCSTQLEHGRVDLTLDIPRDTYRPSTQLPLEIDILEGTASFNLPLKETDNNLVQVFKASELRYKDFKAHDLFLSVTYDRYGVYGRFGGKLYGGYLSGGGDIYLDDNTSWDGWLAGENIQLGPLTAVLTPKYFSLTGVSQFKVMSYGDLESLYTATGTFSTSSPGQMTIHALTPLKEDLPAVWSQLQRSLAERGVEVLRDFPFDRCHGDFKVFHREGDLTLKLAGPQGRRDFNVSLHDHRGAAPVAGR